MNTDAAYIEFSSRGFDATTIPKVAQHAAVERGTIYRFCGSKEQILGWYVERYKSSERPTISFMISVVPP
ncbi:helix-turn-helix domain-containing protein [Rhodococcus sp. G-MC3]|uniref:helix-turn-helix domain-containing protein n=1 Tax=Rhodococcus sp. G-MC3 TaxID=3046209 RepID=UPI003FA78AF0